MRFESSFATRFFVVIVSLLCAFTVHAQGPWEAPPSYYSGATGTGATLKSQLTSAMSTGHILRTYGDFRYSAAITDRDPNNANNILMVYNRASVPATWDAGGTWNREHVWPDSRQPGNASNGATGAIADPHALRPANPSINSSRSNNPFGFENNTGSYGNIGGGYWFPGDADKGDAARILFYMDTRWSSVGLSLTDAFPSGYQMGDLSSAIAWHYLDPPDEFERRRNHTVYSPVYNPSYYTNNRNAYIDRPELVWSVYMNQANDSRVTINGGTPSGNGESTLDVDLGSVLVGAAAPTQSVTLTKTGNNGTYYGVSTSGVATSTKLGRFNAFRNGSTDSTSFSVGVGSTTAAAGNLSGTVTVDNLDVTTGGGIDRGANDGNDLINISLNVLDHAAPSFASGSPLTTLTYDFGSVVQGSVDPTFSFDIHNLVSTSGYTAGLELDSIFASGDTSRFSTDLATFQSLNAGSNISYLATLDTAAIGSFSATYSLGFSDEDLPGAAAVGNLTLLITGNVAPAGLLGDFDVSGTVDVVDVDLLAASQGLVPPIDAKYDLDDDGDVDFHVSASSVIASDSDGLIRSILNTEYGDANLDGIVNFLDASALAGGYGGNGGWSTGNFNGAGSVDFLDASVLAGYYGFDNAMIGSGSSVVPEPSGISFAIIPLVASLLSLRRRRKPSDDLGNSC